MALMRGGGGQVWWLDRKSASAAVQSSGGDIEKHTRQDECHRTRAPIDSPAVNGDHRTRQLTDCPLYCLLLLCAPAERAQGGTTENKAERRVQPFASGGYTFAAGRPTTCCRYRSNIQADLSPLFLWDNVLRYQVASKRALCSYVRRFSEQKNCGTICSKFSVGSPVSPRRCTQSPGDRLSPPRAVFAHFVLPSPLVHSSRRVR